MRGVEFNKKNTADAAVGWEILANAVWGKQCANAACVAEVKKLSSQMRIAGNLVQMAKPDESSMAVQGKIGTEYGPKFKAAVAASKERAAKLQPVLAVPPVRPVAPLQSFMQKTGFPTPPAEKQTGGRPAPIPQPGPDMKPPAKILSLQAGTDMMGSDFRSLTLDAADPQVCRQACADDTACRAYTYVKPGVKGPKAVCFLKNAAPRPVANDCCTSGAVIEPRR